MPRLLLFLLLALPVLAANSKLYLTDGTYHVVREYEVKTDRVRFYSVERSAWEELPLELVDLKRTRAEESAREAERKAVVEADAAESAAERATAEEIARVPYEPGVYWSKGEELKALKQAEGTVVGNKRRSILKVLSPIPIVSGKSSLEIDGLESAFVVEGERPEFYFRLAADERFALVKAIPQKTSRLIEKWTTVPVSNELIQEAEVVETFRHQVADGLYKIWPQEPLEPGQYAFIEYTEGKGNTQVWDFSYRPKEAAASPKKAAPKSKKK
jgi:hypothetical protein